MRRLDSFRNETLRVKLRLIEIGRDGSPERCPGEMPPAARDVVEGTVVMYDEVGYQPPWVGYLADRDGEVVGACAFMSPPENGQVEVRVESFPEYRARGVGSEMTRQMIRMARNAEPGVAIHIYTEAQEDHTSRKLREMGFDQVSMDEAGWRWRLAPEQTL